VYFKVVMMILSSPSFSTQDQAFKFGARKSSWEEVKNLQ